MRRVPNFGLGCVAARRALRGTPLSARCPRRCRCAGVGGPVSLMFPAAEPTMASPRGQRAVRGGAAAVVAVGEHRGLQDGMTGPTCSRRAAGSARRLGTMGPMLARRLPVGAASDPPDLIESYLADDVTGFLAAHGLTIDDIGSWCRSGAVRRFEAINAALGLDDDALELSCALAGDIGDLSIGVGAARPARRARQAAPGRSGACSWRWGPDSVRNWCCLLALNRYVIWMRRLIAAVAVERIAELSFSQRDLSWSRTRGGVELGAGLSGDRRIAHRLAGRMSGRGDVLPFLPASAGRCWRWCWPRRTCVVVDHDAGPPMRMPASSSSRCGAVTNGPYRFFLPPRTMWRWSSKGLRRRSCTRRGHAVVFTALNAVVLRARIGVETRTGRGSDDRVLAGGGDAAGGHCDPRRASRAGSRRG